MEWNLYSVAFRSVPSRSVPLRSAPLILGYPNRALGFLPFNSTNPKFSLSLHSQFPFVFSFLWYATSLSLSLSYSLSPFIFEFSFALIVLLCARQFDLISECHRRLQWDRGHRNHHHNGSMEADDKESWRVNI